MLQRAAVHALMHAKVRRAHLGSEEGSSSGHHSQPDELACSGTRNPGMYVIWVVRYMRAQGWVIY